MQAKEFKQIVRRFFRDKGFKKSGAYSVKSDGEVICSIGLQRSPFTNGYYINVGYIIAELNPSLERYRDVDGDVRTRFGFGPPDAEKDLFEPGNISDEGQLLGWLSANYGELIEGTFSVEGLKQLLDRKPVMLLQTRKTALRFLGMSSRSR